MRTTFRMFATFSVVLVTITVSARADDPAPPPGATTQPYVTWQEYQRVLQEQREMRQELDALKKQIATQPAPVAVAPAPEAPNKPAVAESTAPTNEELEQEIKILKDMTDRDRLGLEKVVISGDADVSFTSQKGANSAFSAGVAPLILWKPTDQFLFEAAFDIGIETDDTNTSSTSFDLTIAEGSFIVNDYLIVGGGLFTTPFGTYH